MSIIAQVDGSGTGEDDDTATVTARDIGLQEAAGSGLELGHAFVVDSRTVGDVVERRHQAPREVHAVEVRSQMVGGVAACDFCVEDAPGFENLGLSGELARRKGGQERPPRH